MYELNKEKVLILAGMRRYRIRQRKIRGRAAFLLLRRRPRDGVRRQTDPECRRMAFENRERPRDVRGRRRLPGPAVGWVPQIDADRLFVRRRREVRILLDPFPQRSVRGRRRERERENLCREPRDQDERDVGPLPQMRPATGRKNEPALRGRFFRSGAPQQLARR